MRPAETVSVSYFAHCATPLDLKDKAGEVNTKSAGTHHDRKVITKHDSEMDRAGPDLSRAGFVTRVVPACAPEWPYMLLTVNALDLKLRK